MKLPSPPPIFWVRLHLVLIIVWVVMIAPAVLWWKTSVPFLVFISVYANIAGSVASWQAARADCDSATAQDVARIERKLSALHYRQGR